MVDRKCEHCGESIPIERLEALPNTRHCTKCVDAHGPKKIYDPEDLCAKASNAGGSGFTRDD